MVLAFDNTEMDLPIFGKAVEKQRKCKYGVKFKGQRSCSAFNYTFDNSMDIIHHCGSCKFNTKEPTTKIIVARSY